MCTGMFMSSPISADVIWHDPSPGLADKDLMFTGRGYQLLSKLYKFSDRIFT